jgi:hypothetical protein
VGERDVVRHWQRAVVRHWQRAVFSTLRQTEYGEYLHAFIPDTRRAEKWKIYKNT